MVGLGRGTDRLTFLNEARQRLRRHWLFAVLLAMAAALRAVVFAAYHPALIFPDSVRYLQYAHSFANGHWSVDALRQSGYSVLIIPVALLHDLSIIPLVQHLVGLATAVLPGLTTLTVAVNVTAWPNADGFADEATVAVVPALLTTWLRVLDRPLALKLPSPLV